MRAEQRSASLGSQREADHVYLEQLGQRLRVLRTARQLTHDQLADLAGLDRTYVSRLERGQQNLTVLTFVRPAYAFDVPTKELLP